MVMDWLTHNPIADLPGPQFLIVYGVAAVAVIAAAYGIIRLLDRTDRRKPPRVPGTFDPYEMAYLCGGTNAVIRTVLYALYLRGLVLAADSGDCGQAFRLIADSDSDRSRTAFR
jgi:uncharacterized protein (TIGR04222 family)